MTQKFFLSVTPLDKPEIYLVKTEQVPPSVPQAQEQVRLPIEDWLATTEHLEEEDLDFSPLSLNSASPTVIELGQQLYNALFQGTVADSWKKAQANAQQEDSLLQLTLGLNEPYLLDLPWELLHTGSHFLATSPDITFSHRLLSADVSPTEQNKAELEEYFSLTPDAGYEEERLEDSEFEDPSYEDDIALVSDLFRQISDSNTPDNSITVSHSQDQPLNSSQVPTQRESLPTQEQPNSGVRTHNFASWLQAKKPIRWLLPLLGAAGILTASGLIVWFLHKQTPEIASKPSIPEAGLLSTQPKQQQINFKTAAIATVKQLANETLSRGDLAAGTLAVEELLNRNALSDASAALALVPKQQLDTHQINFLRGRLAWQSLSNGSQDYSLDQVSHFWERAVEQKNNSPLYLNSLGFAYYETGEYDRAIQVWFDALSVSQAQQVTVANQDALNAYAGLALAMKQSAQTMPTDRQQKLVKESIKLSQKVIEDDPVNFQPEALQTNWMWTEKAIEEWRSLIT